MILARLVELHDRLAAQGAFPRVGFTEQSIAYILVIDVQGVLHDVLDLIDKKTAKYGKKYLVPSSVPRSSNILPNLFWDKIDYVLGVSCEADPAKMKAKKTSTIPARHAAFKKRVSEAVAGCPANISFRAVARFYDSYDPSDFGSGVLKKIAARDMYATFMLKDEWEGSLRLVCQHSDIDTLLIEADESVDSKSIICAISGKPDRLARTHPQIKGVSGAQVTGATLVSFNTASLEFDGAKQGENASIGVKAADAYSKALNWLLSQRKHKARSGKSTIVAWADSDKSGDTLLAELFGEAPEAAIIGSGAAVADIMASPRSGAAPAFNNDIYHILTLTPNSARLSVSDWHEGPLHEFHSRSQRWLSDLELASPPPGFRPTLFRLLKALAPVIRGEEDASRLPEAIHTGLLQAALNGTAIPESIVPLALYKRRFETDWYKNFALASLLKVFLIRNRNMEVKMALNTAETNIGYCLGRLFAVYNKIQSDANPDMNKTIRDTMWVAFSTAPAHHLNKINKNTLHHLSKLKDGRRIWLEKTMNEVFSTLPTMIPAHLDVTNQASFVVGFAHQDADFYKKSAEKVSEPSITV